MKFLILIFTSLLSAEIIQTQKESFSGALFIKVTCVNGIEYIVATKSSTGVSITPSLNKHNDIKTCDDSKKEK